MKLHDPERSPRTPRVAVATGAILTMLAWGGCDAGGIVTLTGGSGGGGEGGGSTASSVSVSTSVSTSGSSVSSSVSVSSSGGGGEGGCGPGVTSCGDVCVDLQNDPANCGDCDQACATGESCVTGACVLECSGGSTRCGDLCVDLANDPANCGECDLTCAVDELCSAGECAFECVGGSSECGDVCVDLQNDPANCGECDLACGVDQLCSTGVCDTTCLAGTTLCGAACRDLEVDPLNCGECDLACGVGSVCVVGECLLAPVVIDTNPDDGALGVALDREIEATFSVPMNPLTIDETSFTVNDGAVPVFGDVSYVGTTATFVPGASYPPDTLLTATITTAAEDLLGVALPDDYVWTFRTGTVLGQPGVDLGDAAPYAILAFNTVTNVNNVGTIVTGDLGISPGAALTGFPPGVVVGTLHLGDPLAADAKLDLLAAYNDAVGRLGAAVLPGDLSGLTFAPGVYANATSVMISAGNFTLDAQGDSNAVFVFQMGTTLTTGPGTQVVLAGGARASNIYWAVGSSATLGTTSAFRGTIMAEQAITMNTGASIVGRLLAQGAAVSLDTNAITVPTP